MQRTSAIIFGIALALVAGGAWWSLAYPKVVRFSDADVPAVLVATLPSGYNAAHATWFSEDIDRDGVQELVACALPDNFTPASPVHQAYMEVVRPKRTGGFVVAAASPILQNFFINRLPCEEGANPTVDIFGDGTKELVLGVGSGGASNDLFGIFRVDFKAKTIGMLDWKSGSGSPAPAMLLEGAASTHEDTFRFVDLNGDGTQELVTLSGLLQGENPLDPTNWEWNAAAYSWNGSAFVLNPALLAAHPEVLQAFEDGILKNF